MPATKKQPTRNDVDLTRKTPWRTMYRIVRAKTVGLDVAAETPWVTVCMEHSTHVASASLRTACLAGTNGSVTEWCAKCRPLAAKAAAAKTKAEAKPEPADKPTARRAAKKAAPVEAAKPTRARSRGRKDAPAPADATPTQEASAA